MRRGASFYVLAALFAAFVLFLYGPVVTIMILSFQGPRGGLTFPMNGVSLHWFAALFQTQMVGDFAGSLTRSFLLALMVMAANVAISVAAGMAFRRRFRGSTVLFYGGDQTPQAGEVNGQPAAPAPRATGHAERQHPGRR